MKRLPLFCLLAASMVGLHAETWIDNARVRRVDPQYENVSVPRSECSQQLISQAQPVGSGYGDGYGYGYGNANGYGYGYGYGNTNAIGYASGYGGERQYGGAVIGGVAGALLGNQIGRGHGREAATALGAVVGAFAGTTNLGVRVVLGANRRRSRPCLSVSATNPPHKTA